MSEYGNDRNNKYDKTNEKLKNNNNKISYINLFNTKIQTLFKEYYKETGQYANWGKKLSDVFIERIENLFKRAYGIEYNHKDNYEIKDKCLEIKKNDEISLFIKDMIENTDLTQIEIVNEVEKLGLSISRKVVVSVYSELIKNDKKNMVLKERFQKSSKKIKYALRNKDFSEKD